MIWPSQNFKKTVLRGRHAKFMDCSCQTRVSRQTCIKNWILWQLPLKNNICTPAINHRWCLVILICASVFKIEIFFVGDVYRTFVPIKFSYISPYKHYEMAFALVPHSCQNLHFKSCLLILWKRRNTADGYFNNIESALLHPNNSVWAQNDPFCFQTWLFNAPLVIWSSRIRFESVM